MRKRVFAVLVVVVLSLASVAATALAAPREDKHWICHRTGSETNPYVLIWVDDDAVPAHVGADAHGPNDAEDVYLGMGPHNPRPDISACDGDPNGGS